MVRGRGERRGSGRERGGGKPRETQSLPTKMVGVYDVGTSHHYIAVPKARREGGGKEGGVQSAMNDPHVLFASHEMESVGTGRK